MALSVPLEPSRFTAETLHRRATGFLPVGLIQTDGHWWPGHSLPVLGSLVDVSEIIETAGNAQLVSPLSYLEGSTPGTGGILEGPDQRITIQPVLPFGTPANLGQVPVAEVRAVDQVVGAGPA